MTATPEETKGLALSPQRTSGMALPSTEIIQTMRQLATDFYNSGLMPKKIENVEQAMVVAFFGRELGMSFFQSLSAVHVIEGVPSLHYKDQLAIIRRDCPGVKIEILQQDDKGCRILAERPGQKEQEFSWMHEEAIRAGYIRPDPSKPGKFMGKDNWVNSEIDMLTGRCVSRMARSLFSDILRGFGHTPDEIIDTREMRAASPATPAATVSSDASRIRKKGDPRPEAQIEEAQVVAEPAAEAPSAAPEPPAAPAPQAPKPQAREEGKPNVNALIELTDALNMTSNPNTMDFTWNKFRETHAQDPLTVVEGYKIYSLRQQNVENENQ